MEQPTTKRNQELRDAKGKIPYWMIAEKLGFSENTLIRWFRSELNEHQQAKIQAAIDAVKKELECEKS